MRRLSLLAWLAALGAAHLMLVAVGDAIPLPESHDSIRPWLDEVGPTVALMAGLRVLAFILVWYLAAITLVGLAARATRRAGAVRLADRCTVAVVRRLLGPMLSATVSASSLAGMAAAGASVNAATAPPPAVMTLDVPAPPVALMSIDEPASPPTPIAAPTTPLASTPAPAHRASAPEYVVRPGDHFWSIAAAHAGPEADRPTVVRYWQRLVDANRDRLADPDNPDLIFAGQVFVLPQP